MDTDLEFIVAEKLPFDAVTLDLARFSPCDVWYLVTEVIVAPLMLKVCWEFWFELLIATIAIVPSVFLYAER